MINTPSPIIKLFYYNNHLIYALRIMFFIEKFYMRTFDFYFQLNFSIPYCFVHSMSYKCAKFIRRNKWTCNWNYFFGYIYKPISCEFNYNFLTNIILINLFVIFINIYKGDRFLVMLVL